MAEVAVETNAQSESYFAALVAELKVDRQRCARLTDLLREDNPIYAQRGSAAAMRMRGWVLLAFEHLGLPDSALPFALDELDNGRDAYLVAAAARALRSYRRPTPAFAPFLMRAIANIGSHDDIVSFEGYGAYGGAEGGTTAVGEVLVTLGWLGSHARGVLPEIEALRANKDGRLSPALVEQAARAEAAIRSAEPALEPREDECCALPRGLGTIRRWALGSREGSESIESLVFEDQEGTTVGFGEFFRGQPSVVVFFYTRCTNPQKCSLTVAKLARLQRLLVERGLAGRIRTAAVTYDPAFDLPARLRGYGQGRGLRLDAGHRMLRATGGLAALCAHFRLGVNFIGSLVNRHKVEVYVLDAEGRIAASFERLQWDERMVLDQAVHLLEEQAVSGRGSSSPAARPGRRSAAWPMVSTFCCLAAVFFPKCPVCWAAYLSVLGIAGLEQIPYAPWLLPLLIALMLVNVVSLWQRGRQDRKLGFYLAAAGACAILALRLGLDLAFAGPLGVGLTLAGSLYGVRGPWALRKLTLPQGPNPPSGGRTLERTRERA